MDCEPSASPQNEPTVLVVDDEAAIGDLVRVALRPLGIRCELARSGEEGLARFRGGSGRYTAVITDLNMPGMDGLAMIRAIRGIEPEIKVIMASGSTSGPEQQLLHNLGNVLFLPKPFTIQKLQEVVAGCLGGGGK